jgi:hypothetical protein
MKKALFIISFIFLTACDSGDSDSGGMAEPTLPGTNVPASFVGVYTGTLNVTAEALGITRSDSFPITATVTDDAMIRFDGDSPEETFTVGLTNSGSFSGNLPIVEDDCRGTVAVTGTVDGTTVSGTVSGEGECDLNGLDVDVTLEGDFTATRS